MPQMAPLNWIFLFIAFSLLFISFCATSYFLVNLNHPHQHSQLKKENFSLSWAW